MNKPNFFIAGVPKAGTTSLHDTLARHPQVFMSTPKELNYFSAQDILSEKLYYSAGVITNQTDYENHFKDANEDILGESSVSYFSYPEVPSKMFSYNRNAKVLIILRNPVERAFSHYLMDRKLGYCNDSFESLATSFMNGDESLHIKQYFVLSEYLSPLQRFSQLFEDNLMICTYDQLLDSQTSILSKIQEFLNISVEDLSLAASNRFSEPKGYFGRTIYKQEKLRRLVKKAFPSFAQNFLKRKLLRTGTKPTIEPEVRQKLEVYYNADLKKIANKFGINLNHLKR